MKRLHKRFLLATFCTLFTATLQAADVTITVNGRVVAKPCTIQTKEANVNLGDLYTRNLQQPGSASGWHNSTSGFKRNLWTNRKQGCSRSRPVSHWCHFYL